MKVLTFLKSRNCFSRSFLVLSATTATQRATITMYSAYVI